jgi:predicted O-methyltransferase YrrM
VTTLEIDLKRIAQAKQHAQDLNLSEYIDFVQQDAWHYLPQTQTAFDFIGC